MSSRLDQDDRLVAVIRELVALPRELAWVEFKHNNARPDDIGEYMSAIANAAVIADRPFGYIVWGIDDATHEILGTEVRLADLRKGNEELEPWLHRQLTPPVAFRFKDLEIDGRPVAVIEVPCATTSPVQFEGTEWIRIGTSKRKLKDFSPIEQELWRKFDKAPFETGTAASRVSSSDVLELLDARSYCKLMGRPIPESSSALLDLLIEEEMIRQSDGGKWDILNLGAIMLAADLREFRELASKRLRVIEYSGAGRVSTKREIERQRGYAIDFEDLISAINALLPTNEVIERALRRSVPMYPEDAIRELVANCLIHQDFAMRGSGPRVEIFDGRIEVTNPGSPLIETNRLLDFPPKSRNEGVASFMRRSKICEERGSGIDKVVFMTEYFQLPAPLFESEHAFTRSTLFAHIPFDEMDSTDRIRAAYLHACLQRVEHRRLTNRSLRERFKLDESKQSHISRLIKRTVELGLIQPASTDGESRRDRSYVPYWG